jgi:hypothetical protein
MNIEKLLFIKRGVPTRVPLPIRNAPVPVRTTNNNQIQKKEESIEKEVEKQQQQQQQSNNVPNARPIPTR